MKNKNLIEEKNEYIRQLNTLEAWKKDMQRGGAMFAEGSMDDLDNNILYYKENIEQIDKQLGTK
jgi:hypothetical protein